MLFVRFLLLFSLLLPVADARAERSVQEEYRSVLWTIALRVHQLYFEEVHPDTLMQAAARGLFAAMDPASEYTFTSAALRSVFPFIDICAHVRRRRSYVEPPPAGGSSL